MRVKQLRSTFLERNDSAPYLKERKNRVVLILCLVSGI
jgi:hypothetical protein